MRKTLEGLANFVEQYKATPLRNNNNNGYENKYGIFIPIQANFLVYSHPSEVVPLIIVYLLTNKYGIFCLNLLRF